MGKATHTIQTHLSWTMRMPSPRRSIAGPSGQVSSQEGQTNYPV